MNIKAGLYEFLVFGLKEARACIFAGSFFLLLFLSNHIPLFGLARYDFLFLSALALQAILILTKVETWKEVKTIFLFHIIGLCLELFKTHPAIASWSYPEEAFFVVGAVPLYSGFMYAAVASYLIQAWRLLKVRLTHYPSYWLSLPLAAAVYINFFTHHFIPDLRWILTALILVLFWKTNVSFVVVEKTRKLKLILSFILIGFFVWIAENISTYFGAWAYPDQIDGWTVVSLQKISSWSLLVIITFIIVADLMHRRGHGVDEPGELR